MELHNKMKEYEIELQYDHDIVQENLISYLRAFEKYKKYQVVVSKDISAYINYNRLSSGVQFIGQRGKLCYHNETNKVAFITMFDDELNSYKIYIFDEVSLEEFESKRHSEMTMKEINRDPFLKAAVGRMFIAWTSSLTFSILCIPLGIILKLSIVTIILLVSFMLILTLITYRIYKKSIA